MVVGSRRLEELGRLGFAVVAVAMATLAAFALERFLPLATLALFYICAVLVVAVRTRTAVALAAAVLSALSYNFFFTQPKLTFRISAPSEAVAVIALLVTALLVGQLAGRQRAQLLLLGAANQRIRSLHRLSERLAAASGEDEIYAAGADAIAGSLDGGCVVLVREGAEDPSLTRRAARPETLELSDEALEAAAWTAGHGQEALRHARDPGAAAWWFLPLLVRDGSIGAVGVRLPGGEPQADSRPLVEAIVRQTAQAAERARLGARLEHARVESESERLRSALLSSVSHDLRSPLSAVIGAASSLAAYGDGLPDRDRRELAESIRSEGERLDRYVQNLLDMTRLGAGPLKLERDWVGLDELVGVARNRLAKLHPAVAVNVELPPDGALPPLFVHPALIEQALFNVLENAAKVSPGGGAITLRAARDGDTLRIEIVDRGPGIPESERQSVFEPFYSVARGGSDRTPRGTGLGLTIVRGLIGAHGGTVEALPGENGVGATLRLSLPLAAAPPVSEEVEA